VDEVTALPVSIQYGCCRFRKPTGSRQLIPGVFTRRCGRVAKSDTLICRNKIHDR